MSCQSAPPARTRPASFSPRKLPPVMAMTRRRPCGVSPSSCGGASVISARSSGSSLKRFQEAKEFAIGARRPAFLLLAPRVANQRAQRLQIGAGVARDVVGERTVVLQQPLAQRFQAPVARRFLRRLTGDRSEPRADRLGIELAHQAPDVLHLSALSLVAGDALRFAHRLREVLRQRERFELRLGKLDQLRAKRLQRVHLLLALRLADRLLLHRGYDSAPMPKRHGFTFDAAELRDMAEQVLARAKRAGASGCDCEVSEAYGLTVTVRKGKPDTIEHNRDRSIGVTVYRGERPRVRRGHATTSHLPL